MKLSHEDYDQLTVMTMKGDLVNDEADRFRRSVLDRFEAKVRDFVLDLGQLDGVDSAGLEALLWLQDQAAERLGQVRLAACPEHVQTILEMTRLSGRFDCHDEIENAIRSMR